MAFSALVSFLYHRVKVCSCSATKSSTKYLGLGYIPNVMYLWEVVMGVYSKHKALKLRHMATQ